MFFYTEILKFGVKKAKFLVEKIGKKSKAFGVNNGVKKVKFGKILATFSKNSSKNLILRLL